MCASILASAEPRQKWTPWPKTTCGFGSRVMSNSSDRSKCFESRLAEPMIARGRLAALGDHRGEIFIHRSADISKFLHHNAFETVHASFVCFGGSSKINQLAG